MSETGDGGGPASGTGSMLCSNVAGPAAGSSSALKYSSSFEEEDEASSLGSNSAAAFAFLGLGPLMMLVLEIAGLGLSNKCLGAKYPTLVVLGALLEMNSSQGCMGSPKK